MSETVGASDETSIRALCVQWKEAATREGGIAIGGESERFRLHVNGVCFPQLTYSQLRGAAVGLCDTLLLPGLNTIIDLDHVLLWSWCGELLLGTGGPLSTKLKSEIRELATATIRASLANARPPRRDAFERSAAASELLEHSAREYLQRAHTVLPYLAFPLLEALLREACSEYVDLSGKVLREFPRKGGGKYVPGRRCSNIADLLRLLVSQVASESLKSDLVEVLAHIEGLARQGSAPSRKDGYEVLFDWRNSSLHGEASLGTIGGTVLTVALLVALDGIRDDYEGHRLAASSRVTREVEVSRAIGRWQPSPWSYYPPFL